MLWLRYPNVIWIIALTCTEVNLWLRKELSVSSSPTAEQLIFIQQAKVLVFFKPKNIDIEDTLLQHTILPCSPPGLGSKLWDGKVCKHKVLFKIQIPFQKILCWQLEKSLSKFLDRTAQRSHGKRPLGNREVLTENWLPQCSHYKLKQNPSFPETQHRKARTMDFPFSVFSSKFRFPQGKSTTFPRSCLVSGIF